MDLSRANALLDVAFIHSARMNWSVWWLREFVGETPPFLEFRRAAGAVMGAIFTSVLKPAETRFPELASRIYEPGAPPAPEPVDPVSIRALQERCLEFSRELAAWLEQLELSGVERDEFEQAVGRYQTAAERLAA
jgi:hypothetical protein